MHARINERRTTHKFCAVVRYIPRAPRIVLLLALWYLLVLGTWYLLAGYLINIVTHRVAQAWPLGFILNPLAARI